jgi:hypothetical protein
MSTQKLFSAQKRRLSGEKKEDKEARKTSYEFFPIQLDSQISAAFHHHHPSTSTHSHRSKVTRY